MLWTRSTALACLAAVAGCSPAKPVVDGPVPAASATPAPPAPSSAEAIPLAASAPAPATSEPEAPAAPTRELWAEIPFPPADRAPPFERSAQEGDGVWSRLGSPGERVGEGAPTMVKTILHPHKRSRFISVTVVAIDLARVEPFFVPGTDDPRLELLPNPGGAGLIPATHHDRLLVVTNGGFAPRHGRWGMGLGGVTLVEPRDDACAITLTKEGRVAIRPWSEVSAPDELRAWRQTPPCLLDDGVIHPDLKRGALRVWAGRDPKRKTRRRSGMGLDETGRILFYGMGVETEADDLARGLAAAGAAQAVELDINYSWTKFLLFGGSPLQVTSTLIEDMKHSRRGYVEKAAFRDFFYLLRR